MKNTLCDYNGKIHVVRNAKGDNGDVWLWNWIVRPLGVKRIRMTCPVCKRRLQSSVRLCHDGCCEIHTIPPHKPKGWWKRSKKKETKSREKRVNIRRVGGAK